MKNKLEVVKKRLKATYDDNNKNEKDMLENYGKVCLVKNEIERNILKLHKVFISRCHEGDLEDNSIRNLMNDGDEIFDETCACLCKKR